MTNVGQKCANSASVSKKKNALVPEAIDWAVEDFAKDLQYFHNVIGLPNVGKIPKDITAEDVPLAEVEKHFGVKAKNDKNGYKKEGVKGIPAEDIRKLVIALDGIEKFQLYSLEITRGLYYESILKRAVNWAACGMDKHKGQLCWKFSRKAPAQLELPPWKRVEHKYTAPPGLELSVEAEESKLYSQLKQGAPSEGSEASDAKGESNLKNGKAALLGEGRKVDDIAAENNLKNDQVASFGEGKKVVDVGGKSNMRKDKLDVGVSEESSILQDIVVGAESDLVKFELPRRIESDREESVAPEENRDSAAAEGTPKLDKASPQIESNRKESVEAEDTSIVQDSTEAEETPNHDKASPKIESHREESAEAEETSMVEDSTGFRVTPNHDKASPKIVSDREESVAEETHKVKGFAAAEKIAKVDKPGPNIGSLGEERPMFDVPTTKQFSAPVLERKDAVLESFLDIMKDNVEKLCLQVEKSDLSIAELTSRMEANSKLLKTAEGDLEADKVIQSTCKVEVLRLHNDLKDKVAETGSIQSTIDMLSELDLPGGNTQEINEGQQDYLRCCSEANALQQAIDAERQKVASVTAGANVKVTWINELDDAHKKMEDEMRSLKQSAARFTQSRDALRAELSRQLELLGEGSVHVRPLHMACPLQSEESWHPITECPVCSLGFFCNNWVPTSCGHCYHPNCLFSLLQIDGNRSPKCEACSEIFHLAWLECWGLPQVHHPEVEKLANDWGLAEQHCSFTNSLLGLYSKNASNIEPRRKAQAAKHKKVTKFYSQDSIRKSTQYHETVGKAVLINHGVMRAELKGGRRVGLLEGTRSKHGLLSVGTEGGENSPPQKLKGKVGLSIVKIENVAPELCSRAGLAVTFVLSSSEVATKGGCKKLKVSGETSRDLVDLTIVKIEKGAPKPGSIVGSDVQCISSDSQKGLCEIAIMGSKKKRKDMGTTTPSPAKAKLRARTLAQNAKAKPPSAKRGHGQKK